MVECNFCTKHCPIIKQNFISELQSIIDKNKKSMDSFSIEIENTLVKIKDGIENDVKKISESLNKKIKVKKWAKMETEMRE